MITNECLPRWTTREPASSSPSSARQNTQPGDGAPPLTYAIRQGVHNRSPGRNPGSPIKMRLSMFETARSCVINCREVRLKVGSRSHLVQVRDNERRRFDAEHG